MQKRMLLSLSSLVLCLTIQAQNTSPYWSLAGNSTASSTSKLGTTNSIPLNLVVNNVTRMRIATNGRVGIGTLTPLSPLHVNGFGSFGNRVTSLNATRALNLVDDNAVMRVLRTHATYAPAVELISRTTADGANVAYWDFYAEPNDKSFRIRDRVGGGSGLDRVTISNPNGYVGIGTTTPVEKLHVVGNGAFTGDIYLGQTRFLSKGPDPIAKNTFVGSDIGLYITPSDFGGYGNTAVGYNALSFATTGSDNTAVGLQALYNATEGVNNTALGSGSLYGNTTGRANSALGVGALRNNVNGYANTAVGAYTLTNSNADWNVGIGVAALYSNTSGYYNIGIGGWTLSGNQTGNYNTALGDGADVAGDGLSNASVIGAGAVVDASNKVRIGNAAITSIGGQVNWTTFSDGRYKRNIKEDVQGLSFINSLRPVSYTVDVQGLKAYHNKGRKQADDEKRRGADEKAEADMKESEEKANKIIYSGFVAQEVEKSAKKLKYEFSGVDKPQKEDGLYGLRYADFVVPLVKAVQEVDANEKELKEENRQLRKELDELKQIVLELKRGQTGNGNALSAATLESSTPNPSNGASVIRYHIPQSTKTAHLLVTNMKGQIVKQITLNSRGSAQVTLNTAALAAGTYTYSLHVNGNKVDSKQLLVAR